ncbi:UPF0261 protein CTC_01794 [Geodia barretti]|uniref:UPF0261 protein CTC_01794 n=1 Tax=Geodia barretti TaxID=519541 RepID=A0AA35RFA0_GEOBA|nr:UPF0261 protein CTC_01794 [Geodia barretti]
MVNFGPPDTVPEKFSDRLFYQHNPTVTLMRTTAEETAELGRIMARKLSEAQGPTTVIIPTQGVSAIDKTGQPFDSQEAREAWRENLKAHIGADTPWQPPSSEVSGWHKDGDFFRHFLDSPEQGLLTIVVWSDIYPKSGGTFVACDSVQHVAQRLYEHPEGLPPGGFGKLIGKCKDFAEITGKAGDVVLLHPFILHAASQNLSVRARFITNPPVGLAEPMNFNRENPDDFSPVELAVLDGLGKDRLDFKPTAPRERLVPERVQRQKKMLEEQKKRLEIG